jgi:hypothetical protein
MLPAVAVTQLLLGEPSEAGQERLCGLLGACPFWPSGPDRCPLGCPSRQAGVAELDCLKTPIVRCIVYSG